MALSTFATAANAQTALEGGPIDVDLDLTIFGQIAIFFVLLLVLKPVLFDPMLKLFEEREKKIEGAKAEGQRLDRESAEAATKYEKAMASARQAAGGTRDALRAEGAKAEQEILAKVRNETATTLESGRAALAANTTAVRSELAANAASLAAGLASRVLGREVGS